MNLHPPFARPDPDLAAMARLLREPALAGPCPAEEANRLQGLFDRHAVAPFAAWSIRGSCEGRPVPEAWRAWTETTLARAKGAAAVWMVALERTLDHLAAGGVAPILLKGPDLALRYYPQPHVRLLTDLDLLFSTPEEAQKAHGLLLSRGYRRGEGALRDQPWLWSYELPEVAEPETGVKVEVHGGLLVPPADARSQALRCLVEDAGPVEAGGLRYRALAPEAHAVFLFAHAFWHHAEAPPTLKALLDVRQVAVATAGCFDWTRWADLARASGFGPSCSTGLRLLSACFRFPEEAVAEGLLSALPAAESPAAGRSRASEEMTRLAQAGGVVPASRRLRLQLFPGSAFLRHRYPEKARWPAPALHAYRWWQGVVLLAAWLKERVGGHGPKRPQPSH